MAVKHRHGERRVNGRHEAPRLGGHERLVAKADHDRIVALLAGVGHGDNERRGLAVGPSFVGHHERPQRQHDRGHIGRTGDHDGLVEAGSAGVFNRVGQHGSTAQGRDQLVRRAMKARSTARSEHHSKNGHSTSVARVNDPTTVFSRELLDAPDVGVTMLLADAAQVADHKLYILGGGLSAVGPRPQPVAIALLLSVPWDRANITHEWSVDLLDEDSHPVPNRDDPVTIRGRFEAGRPTGLQPGTPLTVPLAINFTTLPVTPGHSYIWQLLIEGRTRPEWRVRFHVRGV